MNGKTKLMLVMIALIGLALVMPVSAVKGENNPAKHLYLYEKTPSDWEIVPDGAWGKMMYKSDMFVFNGHGLVPGEKYALINYVDPWGGADNPVLGVGKTNREGNVHIAGEMFPLTIGTDAQKLNDGAKVWLVPTDDLTIVGGKAEFKAWSPAEYLFEANLI